MKKIALIIGMIVLIAAPAIVGWNIADMFLKLTKPSPKHKERLVEWTNSGQSEIYHTFYPTSGVMILTNSAVRDAVAYGTDGIWFESMGHGVWLDIPFNETGYSYSNIVIKSAIQPIVTKSNGAWLITFK